MFPDYYEFQHNTKIVSGRYSLENLAAELRQLGVKKPLLLSDEGLVAAGIVRQVTDAVENNGMKWAAVYTDIPRDSSLDVVNKIAVFYHEKGCDALVFGCGFLVLLRHDVFCGDRLCWLLFLLQQKNVRPYRLIPSFSGAHKSHRL